MRKIKVIKKDGLKLAEKPAIVEKPPKHKAAREIVATVKNWVSDFQRGKREETRAAMVRFRLNPISEIG